MYQNVIENNQNDKIMLYTSIPTKEQRNQVLWRNQKPCFFFFQLMQLFKNCISIASLSFSLQGLRSLKPWLLFITKRRKHLKKKRKQQRPGLFMMSQISAVHRPPLLWKPSRDKLNNSYTYFLNLFSIFATQTYLKILYVQHTLLLFCMQRKVHFVNIVVY